MWWLALLAFADWSAVEKLLAAGQYRAALANLEQVKDHPAAWHVLVSKAYDGLNDPAQAVREAEAALALEPRSEPAHAQLGGIFLSHNTPVEVLVDQGEDFLIRSRGCTEDLMRDVFVPPRLLAANAVAR